MLAGRWLRMLEAGEVAFADLREESLAVARRCGFKKVFHVKDGSFADLDDFDVCFEAAGANAALLQAIEKTRRRGTIVLIGRDTKDTIVPLKSFEKLMRSEIVLKGCWGYSTVGEEELIHQGLAKFNVEPLITAGIPLAEGERMIPKMFRREIFFCKVLFAIEEKR